MTNEEEFEQIFSSNIFAFEIQIFVNKGAEYKGHWILCIKKNQILLRLNEVIHLIQHLSVENTRF